MRLNLVLSCFHRVLPVRLLGISIFNLGGEGHPSHQLVLPFDQVADASTSRTVPDAIVGHRISVTA